MKILNITTSNLHYNGIGMCLLDYYNNIHDDNIKMDYLFPNKVDNDLMEAFTRKGNNLFEFDYNGQKMHQKNPLLYCKKLYKLIKKEKYAIVHVHGSSSMLFIQLLTARFAGVRVRIAHSHNTNTDHKLLHYITKPLFNLSYTHAFACGKEAGEWLFGKRRNVFIIPNGKDTKIFSYSKLNREKYRKKYNLDGKIVIGSIGNFNYQKNHEFLIDVFNELCKKSDNYFLILVGKGQLEDKIKRKVESLNLNDKVLFLGQISVQEVSKLLSAMDVMVLPSYFEGFPSVLIEWQINGLPCIVSDKVTPDVKITNLVSFESIDSVDGWVNKIIEMGKFDRNSSKKDIILQIKKNGYDITENGKKLESLYNGVYEEYYLNKK